MIRTNTTDPAEATALGNKVKREVNKRYRLLEIEQDGLYKCMLLLKKKKYAAVKLERDAAGRAVEVKIDSDQHNNDVNNSNNYLTP